MEFPFDIDTILPGKDSIYLVSSSLNVSNLKVVDDGEISVISSHKEKNGLDISTKIDYLINIIDALGEASSCAQNLQIPITTGHKFQISDHKLYVKKEYSDGNKAPIIVGILKVGRKRLFLVDETGELQECLPLCILDFYVHESKQRKGYGKELFEAMLAVENILPHQLAIDRPSSKFVAFFQKHYNLRDVIQQANNFVIFRSFFTNNTSLAPVPLPTQRHSYAGVESYTNPPNSRPHSLGGVENCFMWDASGDKSPSVSSASSCSSQISPKIELCSRLTPTAQTKQGSSSWNVFGVPPPNYRKGDELVVENQKRKLSQASRR